jgi:hypothetical protein
MSNYSPVSLFTTFSKVFEKVMHNRLSHYLQNYNILVPEYFEDAGFMLTDIVSKSINQKMHVGGMFCNFAKAFV